MPKEKVLTVEEIAEFLKLKPLTIRQMFRTGKLRGFKIGKSWRTTEAFLIEDLNKMAKKFGVYIPKESKAKPTSKKDSNRHVHEEEEDIYSNRKAGRRKNKYDINIGSLFDIDDEED